MRGLTCDRCGLQENDYNNSEQGWTTIDLGVKMIGHRDYRDLCPPCTMWLIDILDKEKNQLEYSSFWFTILIAIGIVFISLAIFFTIKTVFGELPLNKDCVLYSDGKTAIIFTEGGLEGWKWLFCDGSDVAWFLDKGYHVDAEQSAIGPTDRVYMSR